MNRGVLILVPFGIAGGVYVNYRMQQDIIERQAFEDAMFTQLVAEQKERERKAREQKDKEIAAHAPKNRFSFWG